MIKLNRIFIILLMVCTDLLFAQTDSNRICFGINALNIIRNFNIPNPIRLSLNMQYLNKKSNGPLLSVGFEKANEVGIKEGRYSMKWSYDAALLLLGYSWHKQYKSQVKTEVRFTTSGGLYQCYAKGTRTFLNTAYPNNSYVEPFEERMETWVLEETIGFNFSLNKYIRIEPTLSIGYRNVNPEYNEWKTESTPLLGFYSPYIYSRIQLMVWINIFKNSFR